MSPFPSLLHQGCRADAPDTPDTARTEPVMIQSVANQEGETVTRPALPAAPTMSAAVLQFMSHNFSTNGTHG
ncbi:hypothetical protein [Reticulibacter mediterranei]|uniref:hypothetical protein n=1 Tax=Reticulibacter mediterranei TaxID=2778369 RepID=UPI001C690156|nr:hypothetical protein [Reticulibacter mediterranei]